MSEKSEVIRYTGIKRIYRAFINSFSGFLWMFKHEAAFRQEAVLFCLLMPVVAILDVSILNKVALVCAILQVLLIETLNTGLEAIVDRVGTEYHELSGLAKDCGSAAVFISFSIAILIWAGVLVNAYVL